MKKLIDKIKKTRRKDSLPVTRITNDTVAEHRERILAGGRRFKYPLQYSKHKLVFNAIIISFVTLLIITIVGWWQLYPMQNTSEFIYRITKVVPVPVAIIDGEPVLYSDYLMKYRSSVHYLEKKEQLDLKTEDGKRQIQYIKQQSLKDAISDAYAIKLAKDLHISISDSELESFLKGQRQSDDGEISTQTYDAVILDYYGWSPEEFRHKIKNELLRQKVAYAIDNDALNVANKLKILVEKNPSQDLKMLASNANTQFKTVSVVYGSSGWVPKTNLDGGLAQSAAKLKKQQISPLIKSSIGNGYYFVKLTDVNSAQVNYEYLQIPLKKFTESIKTLTNSKKITEFISV